MALGLNDRNFTRYRFFIWETYSRDDVTDVVTLFTYTLSEAHYMFSAIFPALFPDKNYDETPFSVGAVPYEVFAELHPQFAEKQVRGEEGFATSTLPIDEEDELIGGFVQLCIQSHKRAAKIAAINYEKV